MLLRVVASPFLQDHIWDTDDELDIDVDEQLGDG
jgi:hypothetical protein